MISALVLNKFVNQDVTPKFLRCDPKVPPVNRAVLEAAINSKFTDFEDAVLYESARHANAQAIVTRDAVGFKYAKIPVYSPEELIKMTQAIKII